MLKNLITGIIAFIVGALLITGVNTLTAPAIASNDAAKSNGVLLSVMPDATGFTAIYDSANPTESTLKDVPATVLSIYSENSGLGYAINLSTTEGYTHEPMNITVGISADGTICGINLTAYAESKDFGTDTYPATYIGSDSTMANVSLVAGCTYASSAFKNAVADAFSALINNDLMKAGQKGAAQIINEQLPTVFPGIANPSGVLQYTEIAADADSAYLANSGAGAAFITGDKVVIINASGNGAVYQVNEESLIDVTADNNDLIEKYRSTAMENITSTAEADGKKIAKLGNSDATEIALDTFNSVTTAFKLANGNYGFAARPYGYGNQNMIVYYILNSKGEIVSMNADEFILIAEYYTNYTLDEQSYRDSFKGLTGETFADEYLISGATVSSNAIQCATKDVFAAFSAITGGNN